MGRISRSSCAAVALASLLAWGGCAVPDRPPRLSDGLPSGFLERFPADSLRSVTVAPGVWYHFAWVPAGPFAIHAVEVDLGQCAVGLDVGTATGGFQTVAEIAGGHPRPVLVAVNGDFFTPQARPTGPEVSMGAARRGVRRPALVWRDGSEPWIGVAGVTDGRVEPVGWTLADTLREVDVVGGFPELLAGGARVGDLGVADNPGFAASRHPRAAVGVDADRNRLWLTVVDGRQGDYSTGMTLPELADVLEGLGTTEALNLDGGGSAVMVLRGRTVSRPSDPEGQRPVVNALLVVDDPRACG